MPRTRVLIGCPSMPKMVFLPYIYGLLRLDAEKDEHLRDHVEWLDPYYLYEQPHHILNRYNELPDVLGLSCYVWNWNLQLEVARLIKQQKPSCLVVAGGPEPPWSDPAIFVKYPVLDIVVKYDGEQVFSKILKEKIFGRGNFESIENLIINQKYASHTATAKTKLPLPTSSPYVDIPLFSTLMEQHEKDPVSLIWETNRGCPYSCTFCDWGSSTYSSVRLVPEERLAREMNWFATHRVQDIFCADANFGILPRDLEIARNLKQIKLAHGYPQKFYWSLAKNHDQRIAEIALTLDSVDLNKTNLINFQSTSSTALKLMNRQNLDVDRQKQVIAKFNAVKAFTGGVLIVGAPGETLRSFQQGVAEVLELHLDDVLRYIPYYLLNNAPAATSTYKKTHGIKTVRAAMMSSNMGQADIYSSYYPQIEYVVEHAKMSSDDWREMMMFAAFSACVVCYGLGKILLTHLRNRYDITLSDFVESAYLFWRDRSRLGILDSVRDSLGTFLQGKGHPPMCFSSEVGQYISLENELYLNFCKLDRHQLYLGWLEFLVNWIDFADRDELETVVIDQIKKTRYPSNDLKQFYRRYLEATVFRSELVALVTK